MSTVSKRSRVIAIAMGVVAVLAVVGHFGAERLEMPWLRQAAEVVILAEILGFIVIERFELFEPVHESILDLHGSIRAIEGRMAQLEQLGRSLAASGEVSPQPTTADMYRTAARALREALSSDPKGPQILRTARLVGRWRPPADQHYNPHDLEAVREFVSAVQAYEVAPGSASANPWTHLWSKRVLLAVSDLASFEALSLRLPSGQASPRRDFAIVSDEKVLNVTVKILVHSQAQAALSPLVIVGEREAVVSFEDPSLPYPHWGISFRGDRYASLFARWFDEIWQSPDAFTVYSRDGAHPEELRKIRHQLEELGTPQGRAAV